MKNILVVDTNPKLDKLISNALDSPKYNLEKVSFTLQIIKKIKQNEYSLLLLNNTINSSQIIRQLNSEIPIIIMIEENERAQIVEKLKLGSRDYIIKDEIFTELLPTVVEKNSVKVTNNSTYYESLFRNSAQILLLIDPVTGEIVDANSTAVNFYGWNKEELINKTIMEINTLSKEEVFAEMQAAKKESRNYFKFEHRLADGKIKNVEVYSAPIIIQGQKLLYSMIYDISERQQLREELAWQEEKYKVLFETTGTATIIVEEDTTISLANQQMSKLTGYTKEELEGNVSWTEFVAYQDELEKLTEYHAERRKNNKEVPNIYEFHFKDKAGEIKNILVNIKILPNKEQSIASLHDITELKVKEKELNQSIEKARKLHRKFLPQEVIELDKVAVASYYLPAEKLGGDFYNFKQIENQLICYLVDVSGHGLDGALLNISIKEKINNIITQSDKKVTAQEILQTVYNEYQQDDFSEDYFICIQIGILDLETMQLKYNNAGFHIPPILISKQGEISSIIKPNLPVSTVIPKELIDFTDQNHQLKAGDKLLLITDGLFEESKAGRMYGENRLMNLLEKYYALPAEILVQMIEDDFKDFLDSQMDFKSINNNDDITLVVLECKFNNRFVVSIDSKLELLEQTEGKIMGFLNSYSQELMEVEMGLHEMLANAIEHGNNLIADKEVKVEVVVTDIYIRIVITDQGLGFDWKKKLNRSLEDTGCEERGRGIIITKGLFDQFKYNGKGNQVCLIKFR